MEHPEFLDTASPIWIYKSASLYGKTQLKGHIMIQNAEIEDSRITGNVMIGDVKYHTHTYKDDVLYCNPIVIRIQGSIIDSTISQSSYSSAVSGMETELFIYDRAVIQNSRLYGDSSFNDHCCVIGSEVTDSCMYDYSLVSKSRLVSSTLSGSSAAIQSDLANVELTEDSAVQKSTVRDRKLQGRLFLSEGKIYQGYSFLPSFSI